MSFFVDFQVFSLVFRALIPHCFFLDFRMAFGFKIIVLLVGNDDFRKRVHLHDFEISLDFQSIFGDILGCFSHTNYIIICINFGVSLWMAFHRFFTQIGVRIVSKILFFSPVSAESPIECFRNTSINFRVSFCMAFHRFFSQKGARIVPKALLFVESFRQMPDRML